MNQIINDLTTVINTSIFSLILIGILINLALRPVRCWYWKIYEKHNLLKQLVEQSNKQISRQGEIIQYQKKQIDLLKNIITKMDQGNSGNVTKALKDATISEENE